MTEITANDESNKPNSESQMITIINNENNKFEQMTNDSVIKTDKSVIKIILIIYLKLGIQQ